MATKNPTILIVDDEAVVANLLEQALHAARVEGRRVGAVVAVDLFGLCAGYGPIEALCSAYGVPLIEDAAEALGATCGDGAAGSFGRVGILSFNGNKIITTSGGGALLSDDEKRVERARHLASQARMPAAHYEHVEVGYNYRLSNLLAALACLCVSGLPFEVALSGEPLPSFAIRASWK